MLSGGPSIDSKATVGPLTIATGVAPCGAVVQPAAPRPNSPATRSPTRTRCKTLRDAPARRPPVIPIHTPAAAALLFRNACRIGGIWLLGRPGFRNPNRRRGPARKPIVSHAVRLGLRERDRVDVASVIGLAPMGRAPVAEEALRIRIGAAGHILDGSDAGAGQARRDVAGQVEQGVAGPGRRPEKAAIGGPGGIKAFD